MKFHHLLSLLVLVPMMAHASYIMGKDQRVFHKDIENKFWKDRGDAVGGIIMSGIHNRPKIIFKVGGGEQIWQHVSTLGEYVERMYDYPACPEMRSKDELAPYSCTAFLIDSQTVMTAGHCVFNSKANPDKNFRYSYTQNLPLEGENELKVYFSKGEKAKNLGLIKKDNFYRGVLLVEGIKTLNLDFAIVKLDRPVKGIKPLELDKSFAPKAGLSTRLIGHPFGLPLMHESAGQVINPTLSAFQFSVSNSVFPANSGSPLFNNTNGKVIGIVTNGIEREKKIFVYKAAGCYDYYVVNPEKETKQDGFATRLDSISIYMKNKWVRARDALDLE